MKAKLLTKNVEIESDLFDLFECELDDSIYEERMEHMARGTAHVFSIVPAGTEPTYENSCTGESELDVIEIQRVSMKLRKNERFNQLLSLIESHQISKAEYEEFLDILEDYHEQYKLRMRPKPVASA